MNTLKSKSKYIVIALLVASFVLSSVSPAFARDVQQGWGPMHLMPALSDDPITGGDGDFYVMSNLPLTQKFGLATYDTSLTFEQFRESILTNCTDSYEYVPMTDTGYRGCFTDFYNTTFGGVTGNFLVHYNDRGLNAFFEAAAELEDAADASGKAFYNVYIAWLGFITGQNSLDELTEAVTNFYKLGFSGISAVLKYLVARVNSSIGLFTNGVTPLKTHAANRDWYWTFTTRGGNTDVTGCYTAYYMDGNTLTPYYRYYINASTGNALDKSGTSGGVTENRDYYTEIPDEPTTVDDSDLYAVYGGETSNYNFIDYSGNSIYNIAGDEYINNGNLWYNADNKQYTYTTENYYITVNNYYTYNYVNYYMPGSDAPFSTYAVYYQLPDGRNSATLTADDIWGLNLDFDVIPYDRNSEDVRMLALYHLDGDFDNSALTFDTVGNTDVWQFDYSVPSFKKTSAGQSVVIPTISYSGTSNNNGNSSNSAFVAPYSGTYHISFACGGGASSVATGRALFTLNGSNLFGYQYLNDGSASSYSVWLGGTSVPIGRSGGSWSFAVNLSSGDVIGFTAFGSSDYSNGSLQCGIVTITAADGVNSDIGSFSDFTFTSGSSTQFVTTGDEGYKGSLFLDGLAHNFNVSLPSRFVGDSDFTLTYRYYQELSTSASTSYVYFGGTSNIPLARLEFTGSSFTRLLFSGGSVYVNTSIPAGTWNTITLCRSGNSLLFFLNGIQIALVPVGSASVVSDGKVYFQFAADNNVHYIDEIMIADFALYSANHIPRLVPYDSNAVFTLPYTVVNNSIAVRSSLPITGYRLGGVRPTFPDTGMIYCYIENNYISSIQVYNGSVWVDCGGAVYFNGHWYDIENFRFGTVSEQFDGAPIGNSNDSSSGSTSFLDLLNNILSKLIDLVDHIINAGFSLIGDIVNSAKDLILGLASTAVGLLSSVVSGFGALISALTSSIGNFFSYTAPVGSIFTSVYSVLPAPLPQVLVGGFAVVVTAAVIKLMDK